MRKSSGSLCSFRHKRRRMQHIEQNCSRRAAVTRINASRVTTWVTDQVWICHYSGDLCWTNWNLTPHRFLHGPVFCFPLSCHLFAAIGPRSNLICALPPEYTHTYIPHSGQWLFCLCHLQPSFWGKISCVQTASAQGSCVLRVEKSSKHACLKTEKKQLESISLSGFLFFCLRLCFPVFFLNNKALRHLSCLHPVPLRV